MNYYPNTYRVSPIYEFTYLVFDRQIATLFHYLDKNGKFQEKSPAKPARNNVLSIYVGFNETVSTFKGPFIMALDFRSTF